MTGTLLLIALAMFVGAALVWRAGVEPSLSGRIGLSFLFGSGAMALLMFVLSLVPGGWTPTGLLLGAALVGAGGLLVRTRDAEPIATPRLAGIAILAVAAAIVGGHALYATAGPIVETDFLENWGLKGRLFWEEGGIDWAWLRQARMFQNHADYPLLLPLLFDAAAILGGGWDDRGIGLLFTAWGAALLLFAEARLRAEQDGPAAFAVPLAIVALAPLALTPWLGIGEGPFIAFGSAGLLLLRDAVRRRDQRRILAAAVLLGFAAWTKNEGLTLLVAAGGGLLAAGGGSQVLRLWPAIAIASAWQLPRLAVGLETDLGTGNVVGRFVANLMQPGDLFSQLFRFVRGRPLFWGGVALALAVGAKRLWAKERLIVAAVALQACFYLAAYLASPHDLAWHVRWSWERLVSHLTFPLTFALLAALLDEGIPRVKAPQSPS